MRTVLRLLLPLRSRLGLRPRSLALLVTLGLLAATCEGLSVSLIVPLLAGEKPLTGTGFLAWLNGLFLALPADARVPLAAAGILAGITVKNLLWYAYTLYFNWVNTGIGHRLRCAILEQTFAAEQEFLDAQPAGRLVNTLGTETWRVASVLSVLADMLINLCLAVIFGLLLLAVSWKLTAAAAGFFLLVTGITRWITRHVRQRGEEAVAANTTFAHRMLEIFNGLRVVRLFGNERWEQERFNNASAAVRSAFFRVDRVSQIVHPVSEVLTAMFLVTVLVTSTTNRADVAGSVAFLILLYRLQTRVKTLDGQRVAVEAMTGSVREVASLLARRNTRGTPGGTLRPDSLEPGLRFEGVTFSYAPDRPPALSAVDLLIPAGRTTALVGASGAGKSTVAGLLCRLYDPQSGRILIGPAPLAEVDLAWWRGNLAVVSQDVHMFDASLEENIAYGRPGATRAEVRDAARRAHALEFIARLPDGFDARLGERGVRLSGGQKQRIALARALIRDPRMLILDEATNALDAEAEHLVGQTLAEAAAGRTVLVIAHRLATAERADQIIVLAEGRVLESGAPRDLVRAGGPYARLRAFHETVDRNGL